MKQLFLAVSLLMLGTCIHSQLDPQSISIPMRDGEQLAADLYLPPGEGPYPVILIQTPYNKEFYELTGIPLGYGFDISNSPYAFVIVDWRCFWGSVEACALESNRGEDAFDTVEWIAEQDWSNGKVGTWGPSALGNIQFDAANEQPPHLICAAPLVASPLTYYEKYYPGGSLRVDYYSFISSYFGGIGGSDLVLSNPYYNFVWSIAEGTDFIPENINIPMLLIGGWYDHNTNENLELLEILSNESNPEVQNKHKILMGPWVHGGTGQANVGSGEQGELEYPEAAEVDTELAREFFDYYLLDEPNDWEDRGRYIWFRIGANEWFEAENWPPESSNLIYYLDDQQTLAEAVPGDESTLDFPYNPQDPSPSVGGKTLALNLDQGPYDQRFEVEERADAIIFTTSELTEEITVEGSIKVFLKVSTEAEDTDFTVRLTDVYPDGRSMLLGEDIQRLRFADEDYSESGVVDVVPGNTYNIELQFDNLSITYLEGHRIRLIVSSSNYPRFNRNMNTGEEMYPNLNADTLVNPIITTNTVITGSADNYSRIELPVIDDLNSVHQHEKNELNVFPNPSDNQIRITHNLQTPDMEIYDLSGKLIISTKDFQSSNVVNITGLLPGMYLLKLNSNKTSVTRLFSVQR